ncbi:MAG: RecX family transcriptional regulator [Candidatus Doudnabacteria bacterium]|nr:RecX family transcriptional regulator [Candidatus Doudnabacteria bacterium]
MSSDSKMPQNTSENSNGMNYAMFLLNIRLRTEGELRGKMRSKKYEAEIMDKVILQLKDNHYIDDQKYAEVFLENLKKYKSWGYYGIKKKLMEKRLPMNIIESVLAEGLSEDEEMEIAQRFLKKNHELGIMNYEGKQKLAQKLRARGFRGSVIAKLLF